MSAWAVLLLGLVLIWVAVTGRARAVARALLYGEGGR